MQKMVVLSVVVAGFLHGEVTAQNALTATEQAEGFQLLWDGKSTNSFNANWVRYVKDDSTNTDLGPWGYNAANQSIQLTVHPGKDLRSKQQFSNFDMRLEYRSDGNSGVFYRCLLTQNSAWMTGVEYAIDDKLPQSHASDSISPGAAYALYPPKPNSYIDYSKKIWNQVRIVVIGDSVEHWMNGVKVVGYKVHSPDFWKRYDNSKWGTGSNGLGGANIYQLTNVDPSKQKNSDYIKRGYFGLQGDHGNSVLEFRTIRVSPNPYFGPEHTTTLVNPLANQFGQPSLTNGYVFRQTFGNVTLSIGRADGRSVSLLAANGRLISGALTKDGRAVFTGPIQPGVYFLNLLTGSENLVQKLYIVP